MKGARFSFMLFGPGYGRLGGNCHSLIPALMAGGLLGHLSTNPSAAIDLSFLRRDWYGSSIRPFLMGLFLGVGVGYALYPLASPYVSAWWAYLRGIVASFTRRGEKDGNGTDTQ
ncbi:ABC transporter [Babesia ovata]|uniref:ABC transporter n=1 Tax=Babesia ovata TaxID=189622 RepID=A0A2H6KE54_9APIC|nr:ABC transporter [Babesia ovata]GBE61273.1 ABC transporter [Babesia ovata]